MNYYLVNTKKEISGKEIFKLHDEKGIPFEISAMLACNAGLVIAWDEFIKIAGERGWNTKKLTERCRQACIDAGYNDEVMNKIGIKVDGLEDINQLTLVGG